MKKSILLLASLFIFLLSNPIFAQADPGVDPEPAAAPIDDYVWALVAVGLIFAFLTLRDFFKEPNRKSTGIK